MGRQREANTMRQLSKVLAPVDLQAIAWESLEYGAWVAKQAGATLDVLYAMSPPLFASPTKLFVTERAFAAPIDPARTEMDDLMTLLLRQVSAEIDEERADECVAIRGELTPFLHAVGHVRVGNAARVILEFAKQEAHDLIVMGTHGRTRLAHLMRGSVAEKVVRHAHSPVLVVPGVRLQPATQSNVTSVRAMGSRTYKT